MTFSKPKIRYISAKDVSGDFAEMWLGHLKLELGFVGAASHVQVFFQRRGCLGPEGRGGGNTFGRPLLLRYLTARARTMMVPMVVVLFMRGLCTRNMLLILMMDMVTTACSGLCGCSWFLG